MSAVPEALQVVFLAWGSGFSKTVFPNFVTLVLGAMLTTGRRTVSHILLTIGEQAVAHPSTYHRILSHRLLFMGRLVHVALGSTDRRLHSRHADSRRNHLSGRRRDRHRTHRQEQHVMSRDLSDVDLRDDGARVAEHAGEEIVAGREGSQKVVAYLLLDRLRDPAAVAQLLKVRGASAADWHSCSESLVRPC